MALAVKERLGRFVWRRAQKRQVDLSRLRFVPPTLTMPLRRDGVDPVPDLGALRDAEPVSRLARMFNMNVWLVSGHAEARAVLADTTSYSNDIRPLVGAADEDIGGLGFTDPPDHTRLRRLLTPEFTMRRLERLRPRIEAIVERQLDVVESEGPVVDLVRSFAFPIPFSVICDLLGLPEDDREDFRELGHARFDLLAGGPGSFGAISESREFLMEATRQQRQNPGDGLIGQIVTEHGHEISDYDLGGLADGVFTGGYETSASMLALGTLMLLRDRDAYARAADADAVEPLVEELLRHLCVVQIAFPRFAKHDLELFGRQIRAGDVVVCSLSGANRDPRLDSGPDAGPYAGMEEFDPYREPVQHFAFGHGFHRCIGAELARMELRIAFRALARRFPDLQLAVDPADLAFRNLSIVYGLEELPVRIR